MHSAHASLELGRVDEHKLQTYADYFGNYFSEADPLFEEPEFKEKLLEEAKDIHAWIVDPQSWPEASKITPAMKLHAGRLSEYLANAGFEGTKEQAMTYYEGAKQGGLTDPVLEAALIRAYERAGDTHRTQWEALGASWAEAHPEEAAKEHLFYKLGQKAYLDKEYAKSFALLSKQIAATPDHKLTSDLLFVLEMKRAEWDQKPE